MVADPDGGFVYFVLHFGNMLNIQRVRERDTQTTGYIRWGLYLYDDGVRYMQVLVYVFFSL